MDEFWLQQLVCFVSYKQEIEIDNYFEAICDELKASYNKISYLSPDMIPNATINNFIIEIIPKDKSKASITVSMNSNNTTITYNTNKKILVANANDILTIFYDFVGDFYKIYNKHSEQCLIKKIGLVGYFPHTTMVYYLHQGKEYIKSKNVWADYYNSVRNFMMDKVTLASGNVVEIVKNGVFDFEYIGKTEQPLLSKNIIDVTSLIKNKDEVKSSDLLELIDLLNSKFRDVFNRMFNA